MTSFLAIRSLTPSTVSRCVILYELIRWVTLVPDVSVTLSSRSLDYLISVSSLGFDP